MAYVNRLYFRKDTGHLLYRYEYETIGNTSIPTIEQDIISIQPLRDFVPENINIVEVDKEDLLTREKVRKANEISYDPITEQLVFDIDSGILAEIERRFVLGERVTEVENYINNIQAELSTLKQEKEDAEQAIVELSILLAGGAEDV